MKTSSGDWNMMNFSKISSQQPICPTVFLTDRKMPVLWNNAAMWEGNFYQLLRLGGQQRKGIGCEGKVQHHVVELVGQVEVYLLKGNLLKNY